jgi:hypothetical protein
LRQFEAQAELRSDVVSAIAQDFERELSVLDAVGA